MEKKLYEGLTNSGKTNAIKKRVNELIKENKSMLILDTKNEYEELFKNTNYEIIKLNIRKLEESVKYNPLLDANILYKKGNIDESIEKIMSFGNLLFKTKESIDPYWDNCAKSIYTGICLYILENNRDLNIKEIFKVSISEYEDLCDYINKQDVLSTINMITSSVINAPKETRESILSVFNEKLGYFAHRPNLLNNICTMNKLEIKNKNQVILLTNLDQNSIFNIIIDVFIENTVNEMIERKEDYAIILDNFDSVYDKTIYTNLFKTYLSDNIECIVGVRDNSLVKPLDEFLVMYRKGNFTE